MRRNILNVGCLVATTLSVGNVFAQQRPNVVVLLADDMGFGDVSAYGQTTISTPNIDALARGGVCFNNGYATSATSTPSRYGLLTGSYPWRVKAAILDGDAPLIIPDTAFTLPRMFQQHGYATGAVGKWHLGMGHGNNDWNSHVAPGPNELGFDYSCIAAATNDRVPTVYVENGYVLGLDPADPIEVNYKTNYLGQPTGKDNPELCKVMWSHGHNNSIINGIPRIGFQRGGTSAQWVDEDMADFYVSKVKHFIDENRNRPFFLYYGLHQPHVPRAPHQRFVGATTMGARGDALVEADWCVGTVVSHLDSLGLLDNTIIIFSSDNGPVLDDGYADGAAEMKGQHSPTGGLRGGKYSLYDGGTHVPMFVYWRGHVQPLVSNALMCQMDFLASLASLIGAPLPDGLDSENHLDALLGIGLHGRDELVFEATGRKALRSGRWIMIPPYKGRERNITGNELGNLLDYALFDVESDPQQLVNVAAENVEVLNRLKVRYDALTAE